MQSKSTVWLALPLFLFGLLGPARHGLLILAILIPLGLAVQAALPRPPAAPVTTAQANPYTVWRLCQERVSAELKAPASASFPSYDAHAISDSGFTVTVDSYVDAQNSFGALLRTRYTCMAHFDGTTYSISTLDVH